MKRRSQTKIFDHFDELSANSVTESYDKALEFLAELDINTEDLKARGLSEFKRLTFLSKAHSKQSQDTYLLEKLKDKLTELYESNATLAGEMLQKVLASKKISFQFRNLEKWTDDELRDVLSDVDLAKLLEDLEDLK